MVCSRDGTRDEHAAGCAQRRGALPKQARNNDGRGGAAGLCFIVVNLEVHGADAGTAQQAPQPTASACQQGRLRAATAASEPQAGWVRPTVQGSRLRGSSCRSVELNGTAVILAVVALLLRGAHEAAQKVPWKQTHGTIREQQLLTVGAPPEKSHLPGHSRNSLAARISPRERHLVPKEMLGMSAEP